MRFIVDAQLPPALAEFIEEAGHYAEHVAVLGLAAAPDQSIWQIADARGAVIITKDEDFIRLRSFRSAGPPIVWVRLGNTTREALLDVFKLSFPKIVAALEAGEAVVELRKS